MNKENYIKYMRKNWHEPAEEEIEFEPRDIAETTKALDKQRQLDERSEKGIISEAD